MFSLVIFDFDGTLFDTHESIVHSIQLTFKALSQTVPPSASILRYISAGTGLSDTFRALHPDLTSEEEAKWEAEYRANYAEHGQPLIRAFPGARELLTHLREAKIPIAIVSNKGAAAITTALQNNGLSEFFPADLIVGDKTPGATRKPDLASYDKVLVPALKEKYGIAELSPASVLEVGDTIPDIQFAKNIGGKSCWCRFGYGDKEECEKLQPDYIVDSLLEVIPLVSGL